MPVYEYTCPACGPFDREQPVALASAAPVACGSCGLESARAFHAPGGRGPRRTRQLDGAGRSTLERIDRSEQGIPEVGSPPAGRRMHGGVPAPGAHSRHASRPWQIGH
ncbi:MAG TPA: FmdB family zinc ribbon protein [Solirubrobacteraceae bacterium]|jgi:putative FmdB family regulatory protein|nr:FmdB family zinc ribbon protein [Solirubrobacteraceae bacterium]